MNSKKIAGIVLTSLSIPAFLLSVVDLDWKGPLLTLCFFFVYEVLACAGVFRLLEASGNLPKYLRK